MIEILSTPPLNSVQDLGRLGFRNLGMGRGGAMDRLAVRAGNRLLGNDEGAATIEIQLFPLRVRFLADTVFTVTGGLGNLSLDDKRMSTWWVRKVQAGQVLEIHQPRVGARAYLCVQGGIDVPEAFGARATAMRTKFGGYEGRFLRKGDQLNLGTDNLLEPVNKAGFGVRSPFEAINAGVGESSAPAVVAGQQERDLPLRVVRAGEYEQFTEASHDAFWNRAWTVSAQSSRMGYRLQGDGVTLKREIAYEMRSHGIVEGVVQVPPAGEPIIQLADGNSAGGYPKMAVVIEADIWRVAQAKPGTRLRFVACDTAQARQAQVDVANYLETLSSVVAHALRPAPLVSTN